MSAGCVFFFFTLCYVTCPGPLCSLYLRLEPFFIAKFVPLGVHGSFFPLNVWVQLVEGRVIVFFYWLCTWRLVLDVGTVFSCGVASEVDGCALYVSLALSHPVIYLC